MHPYFLNLIIANQRAHTRNLRSVTNETLNPPRSYFVKCQRSFLIRSIQYWNNLPLDIRKSDTLNVFKSRVKQFIYLC